MSDPNTTLMQSIHVKWGYVITAVCLKSSVPPAFLAALVANESGGNPDAKRFEKAVLTDLWDVLQGRKTSYGSIDRGSIVDYLALAAPANPTVPSPGFVRSIISSSLQQLDGLANSWGLTQIMGYEAIPFNVQAWNLNTPEFSFRVTMWMLSQFATRFDLDPAKEFALLFDCWNTGRPHAPTADPQYVPNGLARMEIYRSLDDEPPKAMSA